MIRTIKPAIVLLCALFFLPSVATADWNSAQALLNDGQYQDALAAFNAVWSENPGQTGLQPYIDICKKMITAQERFSDSKYAEALQMTEEVAMVLPNSEKIRALLVQRRRAVALEQALEEDYRTGDREALVRDNQGILDLNPRDSRAQRMLRYYQGYAGQVEEARDLFRAGDWENSLALFKKAWTMLPTDISVQQDISINMQALAAMSFFKESAYPEAAGAFKRLFQSFSQYDIFRDYQERSLSAQRLSAEARVRFAEGDMRGAGDTARALNKLNPDDTNGITILANIQKAEQAIRIGDPFLLAQRYEEAQDAYSDGMQAMPNCPELRERLEILQVLINGRRDRQKDLTDTIIKKYRSYQDLRAYVRTVAPGGATTKQESALMARLISMRTDGLDVFFRGDYAGAIKRFDAVLEINADDQTSKLYRERAARAESLKEKVKEYYDAGNELSAQEYYQELLRLNPQEQEFRKIVQ